MVYEIGKNSSGGQLWRTDYEYDAHGRRYRAINAAFNNANQVTNVTSPSPHPGLPSQVTGTVHDNMGRVTETHHADGTVTYQEYYKTGLLKKTHGAKSYPVEYTYDEQGRMKTMKTWQDYSGSTGAATSEWFYDSNRGWLVKKEYQGETDNTDDYEYHPSGRLWKRHWERGITTVYTYNTAGDLWKVDYSDTGGNPDLTYTYQRRGLLGTVLKDGITTTYTYNNAGLERTQSYSGGVLAGLSTERTYYTNTSLDGLKLQHVRAKDGAAILVDGEYSYDSGGRLSQVEDDLATSPPYTATYGYLANSKLVESVTFKEGTTPRLTTARSYDNLNRLEWISSETSDSSLFPVSYSYRYNDSNQRIRMTLADGSYWVYEYDALGQVKSARRFWSSGELVAGKQFEYGHDDIGNRTETKVGGDTGGNNLRSGSYSANLLNQYTSRGNPGYVEVQGNAAVNATVSINSSSSGITRHGEYFRKELSVGNSSAQYESVDVTTDTGGSESGNLFVPPATENYSHDTDGNLLSDGRWSYSWDQENRLEKMRSLSGSPAPERRIEFSYDHKGRRIRKVVFNDRDDGQGSELSDTLFLYDGWNLRAELDNNSAQAPIRTYIWGLDLSGTLHGAGGVGGLVMVMDHTNGGRHHYPACDGNGNVAGLVDGTDGTWSARYEYGAFGEPLRGSGPMAEESPFRFSTKYIDNESGMAYYGYRYYNPQTGRWLSRDPIGESGFEKLRQGRASLLGDGPNLYLMIGNNPLSRIDKLGLYGNPVTGPNGPIAPSPFQWYCRPFKCGPDYTAAVNTEIARFRNYVNGFPNQDAAAGLDVTPIVGWIRKVGPTLNYDQQSKDAAKNAHPFHGCPTFDCFGTITLCGQCVTSDVPGNVMFGFLSAALIGDYLRNVGTDWAEATDRDGEFFERDRDVFELGKELYQSGSNDICTVLNKLPSHVKSDCSPCSNVSEFETEFPFLETPVPNHLYEE